MLASDTVSACTIETAKGTHVFDILGHRAIGIGEFVRSGEFSVGGHDWSLIHFPDGLAHDPDCIVIALQHHARDEAKVRASYELQLVNPTTGLRSSPRKQTMYFGIDNCLPMAKEFYRNGSEFDKSTYHRDDHFRIECTITVFEEPHVSETKSLPEIEVPPSDLPEHFGNLLHENEGLMDVTFRVGGETFQAHKIMLAMRSPVFKAEFHGTMGEARAQSESVTIEDMQPGVFRALLHFIYTDSLPVMDDRKRDDKSEKIQHLLVAADRYAIERLKLACQSIICKNLNVETVVTTWAFADQHKCGNLKDACVNFISCSNALDNVLATQGYKNLKRAARLS